MSDRHEVASTRTERPTLSQGGCPLERPAERPADVLPTVAEVLALDAFAPGAPVVVVGEEALHAPVRWVHVSDSADVARLLEGGELLLSTGSRWPEEPARLAAFVAQLAAASAAGIVLELGTHHRTVPPMLAHAARAAGIALVVLQREVKFVALTEAVHRRIIADQTAALQARDAVRTLFTGLALRGAPTEFIVEQVGLTLEAPVVLETVAHEVVVAHVGGAVEVQTLRGWARRARAAQEEPGRDGRTIVAVEARGIRWGTLVALPGAAHPAGREAVLEQAATALALGRLADPGGEDWSRLGRRRVVDALVDGRFTSLAAAAARLDAAGMPLAGTVAFPVVVVGASGAAGGVGAAVDVAAAAVGARAVSGTAAIEPPGSVRTPVLLALPARSSTPDAQADAFAAALHDGLGAARVVVGPGVRLPAPDDEAALGRLLAALRETLELAATEEGVRRFARRERDAGPRRVTERPLSRVVAAMRDDHRLVTHAERMLAPILADPRGRTGDLLDVLSALLAHPSNRTAAAEAAHLSRSVFYQRIALLEDLLDVDFDDGEQAAAVHLALLAHRMHAGG